MTGLSSLANRLFVAMALLAVLSIAAVTYYATSAVTAQAEAELNRGLYEAGTLVEEHRRLLLDHFSREARLVADLPKLKAVVSENDPPTVQPIASDYQRELGADFFLVTNSRQQELARIAAGEQDGILQVVSVPIYIGEVGPELLLGTLTVGFALDGRTADRFKALTNSEVIFAADGSIRAGTLPPATWPTLAPLLAKEGITPSVRIGGGDYVVLSRALPPYEAAIAGVVAEAAPKTTAIILRSRTERLGFLSGIHRTVLLMAVGAILAATLASYAISRSVTRPLGTVTHAMRQMASTGDLTHRIRLPSGARWEDEDARLLASTFNTMTDSIERFSREAAQRERLSSLGRLSMVVAHEIRNPLMIIKTSLRALRGGTAGPDQIRATVHDIDEEVERLNRIVSEVLDFAKPIKFDVGPVDVNALCRDAAHAVSADSGGPQLRLDLAGDLPIVDSDAEKLRLALINVLTNARAAVETAGTQHRPDAIRITTTWPAPGTLRIRVSDRGAGIAPEDLPRIFDPFFTTRRAGTGLGLAITRNIIEGLGGTISVSSNPGRGTDVTIELSADRTDRSANSIDSSERNEGRVGAREEQLS
jgi:signal transduction histidine kinase